VEETASSQAFAKKYLSELKDVIDDLPIEDLARAMELIKGTLCSTKCVFLAGNGGSAATASHIANDLMKTVQKDCGKSVRAIALQITLRLSLQLQMMRALTKCFPVNSRYSLTREMF